MARCTHERVVPLSAVGELEEAESRELARHLDSCESCRSLHADLRLIARAARTETELRPDTARLDEITRAVVSRAKVRRSWASRLAGRYRRRDTPRRNWSALSVAAAALVTVAVGYAIYTSSVAPDKDVATRRVRRLAAESPEPEGSSGPLGRPAARPETPVPPGPSAFDSPAPAGLEPADDHDGGEAAASAGDAGQAPRLVPIVPDVGPPAEAARDAVPARTHLAYVDSKQGVVEVSRTGTGKWSAGVAGGVSLSADDRLRTTNSRVRVRFERGSVLYINHFTTLTLGGFRPSPGVSIVGGEVYVETAPADEGFRVETPHGCVADLGTKFGVEVKRFETAVVVTEGRLEASTDAGRAELETGQEVLLARRASPPGPVRKARDLERRFAWTRALDGKTSERPGRAVALYAFGEGAGATVHDVSGAGVPLNLHAENEAAVKWLPGGGLAVRSPTALVSEGPAAKLVEACRATNCLTIEMWVRPTDPGQKHSARVVSLSAVRPHRDFSLGQFNGQYEARLRTSAFAEFAQLGTPPRSAGKRLSQVVFTRDAAGRACLYVDGVALAFKEIPGDFSNWDGGYGLILANERNRAGGAFDRPWLGEYYFLAVYDRALTAQEVAERCRPGVPRVKVPAGEGTGPGND